MPVAAASPTMTTSRFTDHEGNEFFAAAQDISTVIGGAVAVYFSKRLR